MGAQHGLRGGQGYRWDPGRACEWAAPLPPSREPVPAVLASPFHALEGRGPVLPPLSPALSRQPPPCHPRDPPLPLSTQQLLVDGGGVLEKGLLTTEAPAALWVNSAPGPRPCLAVPGLLAAPLRPLSVAPGHSARGWAVTRWTSGPAAALAQWSRGASVCPPWPAARGVPVPTARRPPLCSAAFVLTLCERGPDLPPLRPPEGRARRLCAPHGPSTGPPGSAPPLSPCAQCHPQGTPHVAVLSWASVSPPIKWRGE